VIKTEKERRQEEKRRETKELHAVFADRESARARASERERARERNDISYMYTLIVSCMHSQRKRVRDLDSREAVCYDKGGSLLVCGLVDLNCPGKRGAKERKQSISLRIPFFAIQTQTEEMCCVLTSACTCRQHTSAYVSVRQRTSAYKRRCAAF
jgi:hypothetical protein